MEKVTVRIDDVVYEGTYTVENRWLTVTRGGKQRRFKLGEVTVRNPRGHAMICLTELVQQEQAEAAKRESSDAPAAPKKAPGSKKRPGRKPE